MSNDPFAEPDDTERTVVRPNPGGRRTQQQPANPMQDPMAWQPPPPQQGGQAAPAAQPPDPFAPAPAAAPARPAGGTPSRPQPAQALAQTGMNPLNASASTLFALVGRIRNRAQHMDPEALRQSVVQEVRAFENKALQAQVDAQTVKVARYLICATIDDVVLNTPWGGQSGWAIQSLVGTFHKETVGGDRVYDLLARLEQEPAKHLYLLEFLYMCLSLGFEGRLRVEDRGPEKHLEIRQGLARLIRAQRGPLENEIAPKWKGENVPHKALNAWLPIWLMAGSVLAFLMAIFFGFSWALTGVTERLTGQLIALNARTVPELARNALPVREAQVTGAVVVEGTAPQQSQFDRIADRLAPEADAERIELIDEPSTVTIRINRVGTLPDGSSPGIPMFASGSDVLSDQFRARVEEIGRALEAETGNIIVAGYTDSAGSAASNTALSLKRAERVRDLLAEIITDDSRLTAEGRGEADPVADNGTREGRALNRRVEVLQVKGGNRAEEEAQ